MTDERKTFEDFCRHAFGPGEQHRIHGTGYMFWQAAWQAATAAERERCAAICESRQTPGTGSVAILNGAAAAIRKG